MRPNVAERRVVETQSHADAEQQPGGPTWPTASSMHRAAPAPSARTTFEMQKHLSAADPIDLATDPRSEQGRRSQATAENAAKNQLLEIPEVVRDRIGQDGRQVVARRPGQGLGGAKRRDDSQTPPIHALPRPASWIPAPERSDPRKPAI